MVTLLLGHQGAGKSLLCLQLYVLRALGEGRHVWHNIPGIDSVRVSFWFISHGKPGFTPHYVDSLLHDFSLELLSERDGLSEDFAGLRYLSCIPSAPVNSLVVLDEAQKTCYVNVKNWNSERNKRFAEYLSVHRKLMHEVLLVTQVDGNIDSSCRGLCGEVVFLVRQERLGFLFRNSVLCKHYMGHQTVTALAKPYSSVRRSFDKSLYSLYSSYSSEGGGEIRRTRSVLLNFRLVAFFLFAVFLFVRCGPGSVVGRKGRLLDASPPPPPVSPLSFLGAFEDYHCSDRLYVLRPGGRVDTLPPSGVPASVCPRFNYVYSSEVSK